MGKSFLIIRSNLRKSKCQTASIIVLILLASLLFNLWLMLSMDYHANFERYHDKLNAEHVTVTLDDNTGEASKFLKQSLDSDSRVAQHMENSCLHMVTTFDYNGGKMNSWCVFMDKQTALTRDIGKAEIVEKGNANSGIYLPMLYKTNDTAVDEFITINIGSNAVTYQICGFFNSVMTGSHNCSVCLIILSEDKYAELESSAYATKSTLCSIRLKDKTDNLNFQSSLKSIITEQFPNITMVSNSYDVVSQARYISQGLCSSIMSAMAFLVLLIAIVVLVSNISNYIQVNMKNLGALKAIGYTSRQLIFSLLLQFLGITLTTSIVGAGLSYCLFPAINEMMIIQTGIPYQIHFLPVPLVLSLLILGGTVAIAVWISSRKIKNIEPIVALRSGVQTHNFKKNHLALEQTKTPLNMALAFKATLSDIRQNITVFIMMIVLSLAVVFSGLMTENVIMDITPFLDIIVGESADSCINVNTEIESEFLHTVVNDERVEKIYLYQSQNITHIGGIELLTTICDDFSKVNNPNVMYKGRFPKYDNEIAIGAKYAKEKGLTVGNEIGITINGKTEKYLISGLTQISNNLGRDALMTRQGYEKIGVLKNTTYYLNLIDSVDIDAFNENIKDKFIGNVNTIMNIETTMRSAASVYVSLTTIIVIAILILSAIIIVFVLYLLVRTMLNNKKRDYGILKAVGFTTKQLILQTALSFMPSIVISTVLGIIVSCFAINPLMSLFLCKLGIVKCTFQIPFVFSLFAGLGLILISFALACLLSLKIKKIAPRNLLVGE